MEHSGKKLPSAAFLFLLLLVVATEMAAPVQAKECLARSEGFRGLCFMSHHCAKVCRKKDGFTGGGKCLGLIRRGFCRIPCATAA